MSTKAKKAQSILWYLGDTQGKITYKTPDNGFIEFYIEGIELPCKIRKKEVVGCAFRTLAWYIYTKNNIDIGRCKMITLADEIVSAGEKAKKTAISEKLIETINSNKKYENDDERRNLYMAVNLCEEFPDRSVI